MPFGQALWALSASELSCGYRDRTFSPVEVLIAVLDRAERVNPSLNAIVTLDREGAIAAARASGQRWQANAPLGPLDGVPLTVKDNIHVGGLRATWGSRLFADHVAAEDELAVARVRGQGAVVVGKTNCPEFTLQGYTDNLLFGPTRNPWNTSLTPGGSSGGAVAAVASGLAPLALATDGGGSIRRPTSHMGLGGLKPSIGRVARVGGFPATLHDMEVIGPISRTTADAALLLSVIAGPDPQDRASLIFTREFDEAKPLVPQRILYVPRFGDSPVDPEIAANVLEAASNLAQLGHKIEEGPAPFELALIDRIWSVVGPSGLAWFLRGYDGWRDRVGAPLAQVAEQGAALAAADYVDALDKVAKLRVSMAEFFSRFEFILTPTAAALPWPAHLTHPSSIAGSQVGPRGHAVFTALANVAGIPAVSVPCRPSSSGLPIGFQLISGFGSDQRLLQLAAQYEQAHPWEQRWPSVGS
jgi:aspartyl-tRNA(Asn)/glutamyl-tRNA(Gln) amidotransferase subunit A